MNLGRLAAGVIDYPDPSPAPVSFAAAELAGYLARIFGLRPRLCPHPGVAGAWLRLTLPGDARSIRPPALPPGVEYSVRPDGEGLVLAGASPRALLAGVYALLEAAGCRWSPDGAADEHVPDRATAVTGLPEIAERPAFARRVYASDLATWHYSMPERLAERVPADAAFIDWMAKTGATGLLFIRHANDTEWVVPALVPELERRGLGIEGGGHALVELLPRSLFPEHPEYFPLGRDGRRSDLGNACPSSRAALDVVRARAAAARAAIPGATDLHLWGLDLLGGGWCHCGGCAGGSPSDQALSVCNAAAEGLPAGGRIFHLAYHDTLPPPRTVRPTSAVWAEFAPRERCYAHPIADPRCATNAPYRESLERHLALFEGRVDVFEYYGDAILFGGCAVPLVEIVGRDLEYYARAGVQGVSCLVFGQYSLLAYGANVEAFARGSLAPSRAPVALADRCARRYGNAAGAMTDYLRALERAMAAVVSYGDLKLPPRDRERAGVALAGLDGLLAAGPKLRQHLAGAMDGGATDPVLAAETSLLDYTLDTLSGVRAWLAARLTPLPERAAASTVAAIGGAIRHLRRIDPAIAGTWARYDVEVVDAVITNTLLAGDPPEN